MLNGLHLDRVCLVGMFYGGLLALNYVVAALARVQKLVLLSPAASVLPTISQFSQRGMLMLWRPTCFTVNLFVRWLGIKDNSTDPETRRVGGAIVDSMYLGLPYEAPGCVLVQQRWRSQSDKAGPGGALVLGLSPSSPSPDLTNAMMWHA